MIIMRDLSRSGFPSLSFFTNKTHVEGISFGIFPACSSANYWILDIFSLTSWSIRPCFSSLYKSSHNFCYRLDCSRDLNREGGQGESRYLADT